MFCEIEAGVDTCKKIRKSAVNFLLIFHSLNPTEPVLGHWDALLEHSCLSPCIVNHRKRTILHPIQKPAVVQRHLNGLVRVAEGLLQQVNGSITTAVNGYRLVLPPLGHTV